MRRPSIPFAFALCLIMLFSNRLDADWIRLKEGTQFHGKIIRLDKKLVTIKSSQGMITFSLKKVDEIFHSTPPKKKASKDPKQAKVIATTSPNSSSRRHLAICTISIPPSFIQIEGQTQRKGQQLVSLGQFKEKSSGAQVSATTQKQLPFKAQSFAELETAIRQNYSAQESTATILNLSAKIIDQRRALVGTLEFLEKGQKRRRQQLWLDLPNGELLSIIVLVNEEVFLLNPARYRHILESIKLLQKVPAKNSTRQKDAR